MMKRYYLDNVTFHPSATFLLKGDRQIPVSSADFAAQGRDLASKRTIPFECDIVKLLRLVRVFGRTAVKQAALVQKAVAIGLESNPAPALSGRCGLA